MKCRFFTVQNCHRSGPKKGAFLRHHFLANFAAGLKRGIEAWHPFFGLKHGLKQGQQQTKRSHTVEGSRGQVCLPRARYGYSAEMMRVSGCAYHVPDISTFERHARGRVRLPCARHGYSAEMTRVGGCASRVPDISTFERHARGRVCLPCATHGYSAEMTRVGGCAYHVPGMGTALR